MRSIYELADQYPGGFWSCEECESDLYDQAPDKDMEMILLDVQYQADLSATHCTRCDYAPETGLLPILLEYI